MFLQHVMALTNMKCLWTGVVLVNLLLVTQCRAKLSQSYSDPTNLKLVSKTSSVYNRPIDINTIEDKDSLSDNRMFGLLLRESVGLAGNRKELVEKTINDIKIRNWASKFYDINPRNTRSTDNIKHERHSKRYMSKLKHKHRKHSKPSHVDNQSYQELFSHYQEKKNKYINRKHESEKNTEVQAPKVDDKEDVESRLAKWEDIFKNSKRAPRREFKIPERPTTSPDTVNERRVTKDFGLSKVDRMLMRGKRAIVNSDYASGYRPHWSQPIWFGNADVKLQTKEVNGLLMFRVEARATGYVALAFGNDSILTWVDDEGRPHILDCHLLPNGTPTEDEHQDYDLSFGLHNATHIVVEYRRPLDTHDPDDAYIAMDDVMVQWSMGQGDPTTTSGWLGWMGQSFERLLEPWHKPQPQPTSMKRVSADVYEKWDVMIKDVMIPGNMKTTFWCKIFKTPQLDRKHHIVGYSINKDLSARHMVLHECVPPEQDVSAWERWAAGPAFYGPEMPRDWSVCLTPVAAWGSGSKGAMFPPHVGIPFGDAKSPAFYMLEIHYQNASPNKVVESSGMAVFYTEKLRQHDAGIMVTGITVSALHVVSARQHKYRSAGYCAESCTQQVFPERGINVVSTLLHAHSAGRKISLRHVRKNQELPIIAEEKEFNFEKQEPIILEEERNVKPGDALITECVYDTHAISKPILGGYSSQQEMCLAFVLHYPRIPLAGCYSMTPVKEFFETFGVKEFYKVDMNQVENMFLASGSLESFPELIDPSDLDREDDIQGDDQGVSLLGQLVIKEPPEFRNKTFIAHLNEIPWNEPLLTKNIEKTLYKGMHMTFCKQRDDTIAVPIEIQIFPNFTELEDPSKLCQLESSQNQTTSLSVRQHSVTSFYNYIALIICSILLTQT